MYRPADRHRARQLRDDGRSVAAIHRELGVARSTIAAWLREPARVPDARCFVCAGTSLEQPAVYAYLLGQYLGDGYLVTSTRVPRLRFACSDAYPAIAAEIDDAMTALSGNRTQSVQRVGCTDRGSYWMHWPCLLPQHGAGRKHERLIVLAPWQQALVDEHPWPLIRGLIHSDGCRAVNNVITRGKPYAYPRYFFANESQDILGIAGAALHRAGVEWRFNRPNSISIAKRASVALMDRHVSPKT